MKKTLSVLFALLMSCITASAQIQNGYVRSQGTSYNRTGSPLKGARVFVKGLNGSKVTAPNGTFNFNLGGGKTQFCISSVTLKGYTLLSPLAPAYNVGKAAVEIVMQSREERIQNEARISKVIEERITKSYNAKTRELQKKITTLEKALSDKKKNSDELETQIRSLKEQLGNLDNQYLKRNELIDKMVEEYVNLDYATMNNRKAELCSYIETGELEKADSLLNTIDINKEMNDIKTLNRDIEEKESMLAKEKEIRKNKIETACMYWRGKYDSAIQHMQYDSAAVYVKNLADVDTCNFENVFVCANFLHKQNCFKEAESYYLIDLRIIEQGEYSMNPILTAMLYNDLALLYGRTQRIRESEEMLKASLEICNQFVGEVTEAHGLVLAESLESMALLYGSTQRVRESEEVFSVSLDICKYLAKKNPQTYGPFLAKIYNDLALLYGKTQRLRESEEMFKASREIFRYLAEISPKEYEPELAVLFENMAVLYGRTLRLKESEESFKSSLAIYKRLVEDNPRAYEPNLANLYKRMALLYCNIQWFKKSEDMFIASLTIYKRLVEENPNAYEPELAKSYNDLALLYGNTQRFRESEEMLKESLEIRKRLAKEIPLTFEPALAESYNNLAILYSETQRFIESEKIYKAAIEIKERLAKDNPRSFEPTLALSYYFLACLYDKTQRFRESEEMLKASLEIRERLVEENPNAYEPELAESYNYLGLLYNKTQQFEESEKLHKASIEIRKRLAKDNPLTFEPALAESYNNLALLYSNTQRFREGEEMLKASLEIRKRLAKDNPLTYETALAESYKDLAFLYDKTLRFTESEEMFKALISIYEHLYKNTPQLYRYYLSEGYYCYGMSMIKNKKYNDAIIPFKRSLDLCKGMTNELKNNAIYMLNLLCLVELHNNNKNYTTAHIYNEKLLPLLKANFENDNKKWKTDYWRRLLGQSFFANLLGKFKEGEQYSLEAIKVDSTKHIAYTNLAAALLLQGKFEEAENLYLEYKDEFKNNFIDDFAEFERLGVIPEERKADVERIKAILNE